MNSRLVLAFTSVLGAVSTGCFDVPPQAPPRANGYVEAKGVACSS